MSTKLRVGSLGLLFATAAILLMQPSAVQAHPLLVGTWASVAPPNANMSYAFEPGCYVGAGIWRGNCTVLWANNPISNGVWELRIHDGMRGSLSIRDGDVHMGGTSIGIIDLGTRELTLKGLTYRP
jgi:hypothetical protein